MPPVIPSFEDIGFDDSSANDFSNRVGNVFGAINFGSGSITGNTELPLLPLAIGALALVLLLRK